MTVFQVIRLRYKTSDANLSLRFDVCDPSGADEGEAPKVIGSEMMTLAQLHSDVKARLPFLTAPLQQHAVVLGEVSQKLDARATTRAKRENMGSLIIVPELVFEDSRFCWLLLGAKDLRTNRLSLPPDPYVQISRKIADDTYALVYRTNAIRYTRDCAWKTAPIPLQRLANGNLETQLKFEVCCRYTFSM